MIVNEYLQRQVLTSEEIELVRANYQVAIELRDKTDQFPDIVEYIDGLVIIEDHQTFKSAYKTYFKVMTNKDLKHNICDSMVKVFERCLKIYNDIEK